MGNGLRWTEDEYAAFLWRQGQGGTTSLLQEYVRGRGATAASELPEGRFLAQVKTLAKQHGWLVYHTHDSRRSDEGFPDMVMVGPDAVIFAELKTTTGKLTAHQALWLELLRHTGRVEAYLWRPQDWPVIQARLACLNAAVPRTTTGETMP
jgi:hypothetical protein